MSLVICSNIRDDIIYQRDAEYEAPYSFHNSLKQTLKIDPDSEVAVQSVKLSKSANIVVKESDQWFQFFGKDLKNGGTVDDGPYYPIQCNPSMPAGFPSKAVSMEDFVELIKKGMNIGMPHPDIYGNLDFSVSRDAATKAYQGFEVKSDYLLTKGSNNATDASFNSAGSWECTYANVTGRITIGSDASGPTFTKQAGDIDFAEGGVMISKTNETTKVPLSHMGGVMEMDVSGMATATTADGYQYQNDWQVGLCRSFSRDGTSSGNANADNGWIPYYNVNETTGMGGGGSNFESHYYDYVVTCEQVAGAGNRVLKVHQAVAAPNGAGGCLRELEYYGFGFTHTNRIDMSQKKNGGNGVDLRKIRFTLSNEILKISFIDGSNAEIVITDYTVDSTKGAVKKNLLAPVGQTRWNLYPKLCIIGQAPVGAAMQLTQFDGNLSLNTQANYGVYNADVNWYVRNEHRGLTAILRSLDRRDLYNYEIGINAAPTYIPDGLDSKDNFFENRVISYIFAPSTVQYQHTENANMAITLGFEETPVLTPATNGTAGTAPIVTYQSNGSPSLMTTASLFVRLDNFTQQSYNAGVGRPSKILYHLPRFDTSNRELGNGLYFEPTERTYIKLNNSETLYANTMDISIANDNEQLATDLVGKTIVVLHFRKASNVVKIDK